MTQIRRDDGESWWLDDGNVPLVLRLGGEVKEG